MRTYAYAIFTVNAGGEHVADIIRGTVDAKNVIEAFRTIVHNQADFVIRPDTILEIELPKGRIKSVKFVTELVVR